MKSIEKKILIIIGGIVMIAMICTGIGIVALTKQAVIKDESYITNLSTEKAASDIETYFSHYIAIAEQIARDENAQNMLSELNRAEDLKESPYYHQVYNELSRTTEADKNILSVFYADQDTNVGFDGKTWVSDSAYRLEEKEYWFSTQDQLKKGLIITEPYQDVDTGTQVVTISVPVYDQRGSKILGIAGVDLQITKLNEMIKGQELSYQTGQLRLISKTGMVLVSPNEDEILRNIKDIGFSQSFIHEIENISDQTISFKENGKGIYAAVADIPSTEWKVAMTVDAEDYLKTARKTAYTIIVLFTSIGVVLISAMYIVAKSITRPLKRLTVLTDELASGNLNVEIDVKSKDEVGRLADSMKNLTSRLVTYIDYIEEISASLDDFAKGKLTLHLEQAYDGEFAIIKEALLKTSDIFRNTLGKMMEVSEQVANGSEEIANGAQMLAQGTTEQASVIQELTATVETISDNVNKTAANSKETADRVKAVGTSADESSAQMKQMLMAIGEINTKSSEIGKIIKTIEDIAFQTNILALNAAVEAARAGSAGKGFAVVANEVRNLAGKSAEAAKNTTALIEDSIKAVENGTRIADETSQALDEVLSGVKVTVDMMNEISRASNEQATSLSQALQGLDQVSSVVQTNSATAEESSASSEELSAQAKTLKDLSNRFIL